MRCSSRWGNAGSAYIAIFLEASNAHSIGADGQFLLQSRTDGKLIAMHPAIAQHRSGIAAICQRYGIRRLEVFGSAARADDFDPDHSDADFLVEFAPDVQPGLDSIFGAKAALETLLGRGVDLVEPGAVRNPYVLDSINRNREAVYAA